MELLNKSSSIINFSAFLFIIICHSCNEKPSGKQNYDDKSIYVDTIFSDHSYFGINKFRRDGDILLRWGNDSLGIHFEQSAADLVSCSEYMRFDFEVESYSDGYITTSHHYSGPNFDRIRLPCTNKHAPPMTTYKARINPILPDTTMVITTLKISMIRDSFFLGSNMDSIRMDGNAFFIAKANKFGCKLSLGDFTYDPISENLSLEWIDDDDISSFHVYKIPLFRTDITTITVKPMTNKVNKVFQVKE